MRKCSVCKCVNCNKSKHDISQVKDIFKKFIFPILLKNTKKALDNEELFVIRFNTDIKYKEYICSYFDLDLDTAKCYKINMKNLPNDRVKQTDNWKQYKVGTKETSASSKSDVCIIDKNKKIRISLKSGKGRLATGDCFECNAIFKSVLVSNEKYNSDNLLNKHITKLIKIMKNLGKRQLIYYKNKNDIVNKLKQNPNLYNEDIIWFKKYLKVHKKCMDIWTILNEKYNEYIMNVLFECVTGEYKFNTNIGRADYLIQTKNSNTTDIDKIFKLDKRTPELDRYLIDCVPVITSIFAIKSSGSKLWQRLF